MADIGELKDIISAYVQKEISDFDFGNVNLVLVELNNARKYLQKRHNWHCSERTLSLSVDPDDGGAWADATGFDATTETIRSVKQYYIQFPEGDTPIIHKNKRLIADNKRKEIKHENITFNTRYRPDQGADLTTDSQIMAYVWDKTVRLDPTSSATETLTLDAFVNLPPYTADSDTDWFTENGDEFMQWYCILALNHLTGTFAPRQEGVVSPPKQARDEAFQILVTDDNDQYVNGQIPFIG